MATNTENVELAGESTEVEAPEELEKRLHELWAKDERWPRLIAKRVALRVFPFLADSGHFDFWLGPIQKTISKEERQDNRVEYLLSLFVALVDDVSGSKAELISSIPERAAYDVSWVSSNSLPAIVGKLISLISEEPISPDIAINGILKAIEASSHSSHWIMNDLEISSIEELKETPLWDRINLPEEIQLAYYKLFKPTVEALAKETRSEKSRLALQKMLTLYEHIAGLDTVEHSEPEIKPNQEMTEDNANIQHDSLNRSALVKGLAAILAHENNFGHLTIGLLGHWGSGKSSLMSLVKVQLQQAHPKTPFLFGTFNAWAYEHSDNIQAAMAHEVINSLTSDPAKQEDKRGFYDSIKRYVKWLPVKYRLVFGFAMQKYPARSSLLILQLLGVVYVIFSAILEPSTLGIMLVGETELVMAKTIAFFALLWNAFKDVRKTLGQSLTKDWLTYVRLPNYAKHIGEVSEMRKDIELMCQIRLGVKKKAVSDKKRLLFVVDDLDRCGPDGIVKTFEAIRLVLNIPQVTVVIAIDQRIALAALAKHYEPLEKHHQLQNAKTIARDYLGKMIQLPIVLPEADQSAITQLMGHVWEDNAEAISHWQSLIEPSESVDSDVSQDGEDYDSQPSDIGGGTELTEEQLANMVNQLSVPERTKSGEPIVGVSSAQKAAFVYWADQFALKNPRQLKRLHNSYNLLRTVYGREDNAMAGARHAYPYLVALMLLEWINNRPQAEERSALRSYLLHDADVPAQCHAVCIRAVKIIESHANQEYKPAEDESPRTNMLGFVDGFVLPAIGDNVSHEF